MTNTVVVSSDDRFDHDVIDASMQRLVLVDVWADWCAPCRALLPVLEKLSSELGEQLAVVKVNADECHLTAERLGIKSLPTVLLFHKGELVDRFQGALPEQQIRAFLDPYIEHDYDQLVQSGLTRLEQGDDAGIDELRAAAALAKDNVHVLSTLITALLDAGRDHPEWLQEAGACLGGMTLVLERDPKIQKLRARYTLLSQAGSDIDLHRLRQEAEIEPTGSSAFKLAQSLAAQEHYADALERMMMIMKQPGQGIDREVVRQSLVALINTCPDAQLANTWRRQLFAVLH